MSPNTSPVLEALPVEVMANVLRQMASPEDVYSTIRASPKALGSFGSFRESILIEVLQVHLPAEIFAEYLGLLHVPRYEDFNYVPEEDEINALQPIVRSVNRLLAWEQCRNGAWPDVLHAFFETHFENVKAAKSSGVQKYKVPQPADKYQVNYIISMYGILKQFIRDYQPFVRMILIGHPPPLCDLGFSFRRQEAHLGQDWPPLTKTEAVRLQRGFLRYELCSRLSAISTWKANMMQWDRYGIKDDEDSISKYLQLWEEEEIRCAWTFIHRQYQILAQEVVAELRCDVRRLHRKARYASDSEITLAPYLNVHGNSEGAFIKSWTYNMSCLGLPMLQQLLQSEFDDQRRLLKNTFFDRELEFWEPLFLQDENTMGNKWGYGTTYTNLRKTNGASPLYRPIALELLRWPKRDYVYMDPERLEEVERALKEMGWVFWEKSARLENVGWYGSDEGTGNRTKRFLERISRSNLPNWFEVEEEYPERCMFVTKEDHKGELSAKYALSSPEPGAEEFFLDRLRDISDWPSKEASPAFQEICRGLPTSE